LLKAKGNQKGKAHPAMRFLPKHQAPLLASLVGITTITVGVTAWFPTPQHHHHYHHYHHLVLRPTTTPATATSTKSLSAEEAPTVPDFAGKTIYQRTFYRLSSGSKVAKPNALVVEERVRYRPDPNTSNNSIAPWGPATLILREGTADDEITKELYRFNGATTHAGPGAMETTIATILCLASNPQILQGTVLQVGCESGLGGLLGCIAAKFTGEDEEQQDESTVETTLVQDEILTVPDNGASSLFPSRLHHLTLTDESRDALNAAYENIRRTNIPASKLSLKELSWSVRAPPVARGYSSPQQRVIRPAYRAIVGSDIDFSYPSAKELARTVANSLLPSNPLARANSESTMATASGGGGSFGGLGMAEIAPLTQQEGQPTTAATLDIKIPPTFCHVAPDSRQDLHYLRQFLERGFRMEVDVGYLKLQRLRFVYQVMPQEAPEDEVEDLDLELQEESVSSYQSIMAVHHPDYAGDGTGEYFFPLETGEYEGGTRSTYLEPEEGNAGSPW
jgi:hypothetical protein